MESILWMCVSDSVLKGHTYRENRGPNERLAIASMSIYMPPYLRTGQNHSLLESLHASQG